MSIPNPFRPVCGAGETWLPYVQPIMTSATTWSNTPSFGCEWDATSGYAGYNAWKCMSANSYWWSSVGSQKTALLTFEKPLRIESVTFSDGGNHPTSLAWRIAFEANVNGEWVMLGEWVRPEGLPYTEEITLDLRKVVAREFRVTNENSNGYSSLNRLQLNAFFKP